MVAGADRDLDAGPGDARDARRKCRSPVHLHPVLAKRGPARGRDHASFSDADH